MSNLFWLTEEQMGRLGRFFPKSGGKSRADEVYRTPTNLRSKGGAATRGVV